jgi:two-component system repressor protein LuxO
MTTAMLSASAGETGTAGSAPAPRAEPVASYRDQERAIIERALAAFAGNIPKAAAALDISPSTIYRKRQSWGACPAL